MSYRKDGVLYPSKAYYTAKQSLKASGTTATTESVRGAMGGTTPAPTTPATTSREERIKSIPSQIEEAKEKIASLQETLSKATESGYGPETGKDIPEEILAGEPYQEEPYQEEPGVEEPGEGGYDTGNADLNAILDSMQGVLTSIIDSGKIINPKVDITPERLTELTDQVSNELDPYYKSQFDAIKNDLSLDLGQLSDQYNQAVESQKASFTQTLASQRESEAGRGTIFSGGRKTREQQLAESGQRSMEGLSSSLEYQAGKAGTAVERTLGSEALGGSSLASYSPRSVSTLGEGQYVPLGSRSLFTPQGGVIGSLERTQIEKKRGYLDLLKSRELEKLNI